MTTALTTQANGRLAVRHRAPSTITCGETYTYLGPGPAPGTAAYRSTKDGQCVVLFYASPYFTSSSHVVFTPQNHHLRDTCGCGIWVSIRDLDGLMYYGRRELYLVGPVSGTSNPHGAGAWKCTSA